MTKCKHGIQSDWCSECEDNPFGGISRIAFVTFEKDYGVSLDSDIDIDKRFVDVFLVNKGFTKADRQVIEFARGDNLDKNHIFAAVMEYGRLFLPSGPLSRDKWGQEEKATCYNCKRYFTHENYESFGCDDCRYYACICGHCFCNNPPLPDIPAHDELKLPKRDRSYSIGIMQWMLKNHRKR